MEVATTTLLHEHVILAVLIRNPHPAREAAVGFVQDGGGGVEVEGYGYCFRPTVSLEDPEWRPYTEGSWIYSDAGWTWDSDEDFGWATYHYGHWFLLGGTSSLPTQVWEVGSMLVPIPPLFAIGITAPSESLVLPISGGGGPGSLFVQWVIQDPAATSPTGWYATNAIRIDFLP